MIIIRRITGYSMSPTLNNGVVAIFINKKHLNVGDIVIAKVGQREVVKRISEIKKDKVFLIGDNLEHSTDSRDYGRLDTNCLMGKLIWPRR